MVSVGIHFSQSPDRYQRRMPETSCEWPLIQSLTNTPFLVLISADSNMWTAAFLHWLAPIMRALSSLHCLSGTIGHSCWHCLWDHSGNVHKIILALLIRALWHYYWGHSAIGDKWAPASGPTMLSSQTPTVCWHGHLDCVASSVSRKQDRAREANIKRYLWFF